MEYEMKRKQRTFYILSPDYDKTLKVLTAKELAKLLGVERSRLEYYLSQHPTYKGCPIGEE